MDDVVLAQAVGDQVQQFRVFGGVLLEPGRDGVAASEHSEQHGGICSGQLLIAP